MRKLYTLTTLAFLMAALSSPLNAAVEDCEVLKGDGGTKGLYGLCIAYWRAEADDVGSQNQTGGDSSRLLDKYNQIRDRIGGPAMPGLSDTLACPCWDHLTADGVVENAAAVFCSLGTDVSFDALMVYDNTGPARLLMADNVSCIYTGLDHETVMSFGPQDDSGLICRDEIEQLCP